MRKNRRQKIKVLVADSETPAARAIWAGVGIIMVVSYLVFVTFLKG